MRHRGALGGDAADLAHEPACPRAPLSPRVGPGATPLPRGLAVDWTDHETWSRARPVEDPHPANDPDASFGHAKLNAPGAKDYLFFGYYAQVATMVRDEREAQVPELVRRIAVAAPRLDPAAAMTQVLLRLHHDGVTLGDVLADGGYSNRLPETFAAPLRRAGANLVLDLHPGDRGRHGTFEGANAANGALFCPATPGCSWTSGRSSGGQPKKRRRHTTPGSPS